MNKITKYLINILMFVTLIVLSIVTLKYIILFWPSAYGDKCTDFCGMEINMEKRYFLLVALGGVLGSFVHVGTSFVDYLGNKQIVYSWLPWYLMRPFIGAVLAIIFYMLLRGGIVSTQVLTPFSVDKQSVQDKNTVNKLMAKPISPKTGSDTLTVQNEFQSDSNKKFILGMSNIKEQDPLSIEQKPEPPLPFNPFGVMTIACLTGMFSKQAIDKLREVFESFFNIKKETPRDDSLNKPIN